MVREPNEQLAAVMSRAGCSHKGLARRVCQVGAEHGVELRYDHVAVGRWLDGTQPRGLAAHFLAMALSRKLGEPVEPRDIGMARGSVTALSTVEYAEHTSDALDQVTGLLHSDLAGQSQHVPQLRPEAWNELMVRWLLAPDDHDDPIERDQPTQVTAAAIEAVRVTTDVFSKLDYQFGGGHARLAVLHYVNTDVTPLVRSADPESPLGRELLAAAAALLRLVGWTAYDTGLHGMAQRYLAQALRLADAAGDRMLGGRILAGMSHQANFLGYHDHAADLARAAKKGARASATPTAMALFSAMEARALAAKGDPVGCLRRSLALKSGWNVGPRRTIRGGSSTLMKRSLPPSSLIVFVISVVVPMQRNGRVSQSRRRRASMFEAYHSVGRSWPHLTFNRAMLSKDCSSPRWWRQRSPCDPLGVGVTSVTSLAG